MDGTPGAATHEVTVTDGTITVAVTVVGGIAGLAFGVDGELNGTTPALGDVITWDGTQPAWVTP